LKEIVLLGKIITAVLQIVVNGLLISGEAGAISREANAGRAIKMKVFVMVITTVNGKTEQEVARVKETGV
jgi:hypothetical protein